MKPFQILKGADRAEAIAELDELSRACSKRRDYFRLSGGQVVEVDKPKPARDLWYDDEQPDPAEGPGGLEAAFVSYNMQAFPFRLYDNWAEKRAHGVGGYLKRPAAFKNVGGQWFLVWRADDAARLDARGIERVELSAEDVDALAAMVERFRGEFAGRLRSYFRKYADKVYTRGYWANR